MDGSGPVLDFFLAILDDKIPGAGSVWALALLGGVLLLFKKFMLKLKLGTRGILGILGIDGILKLDLSWRESLMAFTRELTISR